MLPFTDTSWKLKSHNMSRASDPIYHPMWLWYYESVTKLLCMLLAIWFDEKSHNRFNHIIISLILNRCSQARTSSPKLLFAICPCRVRYAIGRNISYYHIFCCNMFVFACPIIAKSQCCVFALIYPYLPLIQLPVSAQWSQSTRKDDA